MENQLAKIIEENKLDKTKGQVLLENFSNYFEIAADWEAKTKALIVTDVSQIAEMKMADEGRKFLKEKRVAIENTRKKLKESSLREGQTIDAIAKILTNLIVPIENELTEKAKFRELKEAAELAQRTTERIELLMPFNVAVDSNFIGSMPEPTFQAYLTGLKVEKEQKEAAEKKAELERIAKEKSENEERERIRLENIRLKFEAEGKEKALKIERKKQAEILAAQKAESDRLAKIEAEKQAILNAKIEAERKESERILLEERKKAKERLDAEMEQARKLAAELEAKKKAEQDAIDKEIATQKQRLAEEKKAAKAPDKQKLNIWVDSFFISEAKVNTQEGFEIEKIIREKFTSFKSWAKIQIENI